MDMRPRPLQASALRVNEPVGSFERVRRLADGAAAQPTERFSARDHDAEKRVYRSALVRAP